MAWTDTDGGDHGGADWAPINGTYIAGSHTNVGTFTVPAGATVRVQPWNGSTYGNVSITADNIIIAGVLSATGAGYGGGGGGGGGVGTTGPNPQADPCSGACKGYSNSSGGAGTRGGSNGGGGYKLCANKGTSVGGNGGNGGGPYRGGAGSGVTRQYDQGAANGNSGGRGGYAANGTNGDASTDESLRMGSGGGGGGGGACSYEPGRSSVGGSGGGGAGGSGGGWIKMIANDTMTISGAVYTNGAHGGNGGSGTDGRNGQPYGCDYQGSGGNGGGAASVASSAAGSGATGYQNNSLPLVKACFPPGYPGNPSLSCYGSGIRGGNGGSGGHGAGGGLLLKTNALNITGTLNGLGSGNDAVNGGTLKYGYCSITGALPTTNFTRVYELSTTSCAIDIGLRYMFPQGNVISIAGTPDPAQSPLRILRYSGAGNTGALGMYGVALVPVGDPKASGVKIMTPQGVRSLRVYP